MRKDLKKMILIESEKCCGCRTCEQVCSLTTEKVGSSSRSRIRILRWQMKGVDLPIVCLQCEDPLCRSACPLNALIEDPNSEIVKVDQDACVGCKLCSYVCPVGAIFIDREKGKAVKCDQCDGDPVCVKFCPTEAIKYLDYDKAIDALKRSRAKKLLELVAPTIKIG